MSNRQKAGFLARALMETPERNNVPLRHPIRRIQFMAGFSTSDEEGAGGLDEIALAAHLERYLDEYDEQGNNDDG